MPPLPHRLTRTIRVPQAHDGIIVVNLGIAQRARPLPPMSKTRPTLMRITILAILLTTATTLAHAATGVLGDWKSPTTSIVRVYPCGPEVCLKIVKLGPDSAATTDQQNPDSALRSRALCGLTIGTGFHQSDPTHLTDGHLYDPKSGHTYRGTIAAEGDTLKLHGYIGISLFGRTETWQRVPTIEACR